MVLDTGPLITLAAADSLDLLSYPASPVAVPDAVFYEATNKQGSLGQQAIIDWARTRASLVRIVPTEVFADASALLLSGVQRPRKGLGEEAAYEVLRSIGLGVGEFGILIAEDADVLATIRERPEFGSVLPLTTPDFLDLLESEGWINSADQVLAAAEDAGRHISRARALTEEHERGMAALRAVMRKPTDEA